MDPLATTPPPQDAETSRPTVPDIPSRRIHGEHVIRWLRVLGGREHIATPTSTKRLSGSQH
jgi:hypothetical protein